MLIMGPQLNDHHVEYITYKFCQLISPDQSIARLQRKMHNNTNLIRSKLKTNCVKKMVTLKKQSTYCDWLLNLLVYLLSI